jgi:hypothetical protein
VAYSARLADIPASTGYGEPILRFSMEPFVEPSTHAGCRFARVPDDRVICALRNQSGRRIV